MSKLPKFLENLAVAGGIQILLNIDMSRDDLNNSSRFVLLINSDGIVHDLVSDNLPGFPSSQQCEISEQIPTSSLSSPSQIDRVEINISSNNIFVTASRRNRSLCELVLPLTGDYDKLTTTNNNDINPIDYPLTSIKSSNPGSDQIEITITNNNGVEASDGSAAMPGLHTCVSHNSPITINNDINNRNHHIHNNNLDDLSVYNVGTVTNLVHTTPLVLNKITVCVTCGSTYSACLCQPRQSQEVRTSPLALDNCASDSETPDNKGDDHNNTRRSQEDGSAILPSHRVILGTYTQDQLPSATPISEPSSLNQHGVEQSYSSAPAESPHHGPPRDGLLSSSSACLPAVLETDELSVTVTTAQVAVVPQPTVNHITISTPPPSDTPITDTASGSADIIVESVAALEFIREPRQRCNTLDPKARSFRPHHTKHAKTPHHSGKKKFPHRSDTRSWSHHGTHTNDYRSSQPYGWFLLPLSHLPFPGVNPFNNTPYTIPSPPPLPNNWSPHPKNRHAGKSAAHAPDAVKTVKSKTDTVNTQRQLLPVSAPQDKAPHSHGDSLNRSNRKSRNMARCRAWRSLCESRTRVDKT